MHTCVADMSLESGRNILLDASISLFGDSLDCLINNVGTNIRKSAIEYDSSEYAKIMETNLVSAFSLSQKFYSQLQKSGRGSVVNVGSVAGYPLLNKFF